MSTQLSFDLPAIPALGRDDFFISPANALALALLDHPEAWPAGKMVLTGPEGAGKSHLVAVWAAQTTGQVIQSSALTELDIAGSVARDIAVEDIDQIAADHAAQTALFHLHNLAAAEGRRLLMTARHAPQNTPFTLPDLASRLQAAQIAALEAPDDALLSAVLMKLFADRQINPPPGLIPYLLRRMDRSFVAASQIVTALDRAALEAGKPVSRSLAALILDKAAPES